MGLALGRFPVTAAFVAFGLVGGAVGALLFAAAYAVGADAGDLGSARAAG